MADNKIKIDVEVDDKGTTKKVGLESKKTGENLGNLGKSAGEADRNIKGLAQTSANGTKNFSKYSQGMQGLVAGYATLAAQLFALSAAFNFLKSAGQLEQLKAGQIAYASTTGIALRTLTSDIRAATDAQISFTDAAQAAAIGTAAGLSADQLSRLGTAAKNASQILGRDVTDSFNRLVRGVTKAEPELLDELGIILRLKDASEAYARQMDKDVNSLTQFEKSQAVANDVLTQAETKYARMLEIVGSTPNQYAQLGSVFEDLLNDVKELVSSIAGPFASVLKDTPALGIAGLLLLLNGPMKAIGIGFGDIADSARESADKQVAALEAVRAKAVQAKKSYSDLESDLRKQAAKAVGAGASSKTLEKLTTGQKFGKRELNDLKRSLTAAETQIKNFNEIRKGAFVGADREIIASIRKTLTEMETATEEQVTKWQALKSKLAVGVGEIKAGFSKFFAAITIGVGRLISIFGTLALVVTGVKTAIEFLRKEGILNPKIEEQLDNQTILLNLAKERVIGLSEEYEKFAKTQLALYATLRDTNTELAEFSTQAGTSLATMVTTSFSTRNIDAMTISLSNYKQELAAVEEYNIRTAQAGKFFENSLKLQLSPLGQLVRRFEVVKNVANLTGRAIFATTEITKEYLNTLSEELGKPLNLTVYRAQISEVTQATKDLIKETQESLSNYKKELTDLGAVGFTQFDKFSKALENFGRIGEENLSQEQILLFTNNLKEAGKEVAILEQALKALPEAEKAASEAFGRLSNSILGVTQGDAAARAIKGQIQSLKTLRDSAVNPEQVSVYDNAIKNANERLELSVALSEQENQKKIKTLELQLQQIRNYDTMLKAQGDILRKEDEIAYSKLNAFNIEQEMANVRKLSMLDNGQISEEGQRQLNLLWEQLQLEWKKTYLYEQQLELLKATKLEREAIERAQTDTQVLQVQKDLITMLDKERSMRAEINKLSEQSAYAGIERSARGLGRFQDKEKFIADKKYELELKLLPVKQKQIEDEYNAKLKQIDIEYDLLEAKKVIQENELRILAEQLRVSKDPTQQAKAGTVEGLADRVAGQDFTEAKQLAKDLAEKTKNTALEGLLDNLDKLKEAKNDLSEAGKFADALEDSLSSGLTTAISGVIQGTTSMKDAFANMAVSVLRMLADLIAQMIAMRILASAFGIFTGGPVVALSAASTAATTMTGQPGFNSGYVGGGTGIEAARTGGVISEGKKLPGYAVGGVAKGPDSGYPVMMHGTEAVVPLPNGKSIPVEMKGMGQNNNVVVNVSVDGQGKGQATTEAQNSADAGNLGQAIAKAVQQELQNQKRSGGILNPYGVA